MLPGKAHVGVGWQGVGWSMVLADGPLEEGCSTLPGLGRRLLA
jgi:hypothetical protein